MSLARGASLELPLSAEIARRDGEPWCGVLVVNLSTGDIVEWVRLEGHIAELFDVAALPGVQCPMSIGLDSIEVQNTISFDPQVTPLT